MLDRSPVITLRSSPSLVEVAYEAIVEAILDKRLQAGERVAIDQVARDLEMSITPLREALTRAAADGLLVQSRNRGFAVAPLLTHTTYRQLFAVRRLLETHAANAGPTSQDLDALKRAHRQMAALKPAADYAMYRRFNRLDHAFHQRVIAIAANPYLVGAWNGLHFHMQMSRLYAGQGVIDHDDAVREHARIIHALRDGRGDKAADAVRAHVDRAERRLLHLLPSAQPADAAEPADEAIKQTRLVPEERR